LHLNESSVAIEIMTFRLSFIINDYEASL
jgi:hypothetical protein